MTVVASRAGAALAVLLLAVVLAAAGTLPPVAWAQDAGADGFRRFTVSLPGGRPLVFRFAARDSAAAAALARAVGGFLPAPLAAAGLPPDTFHVVIAPSEAAFRELTGGRSPDWGLAVAFPALDRIVIRSPRLTGSSGADPATVLRHELGHLYLDAGAGGSGQVPRWFNEGFAALYADEWRWVSPIRLAWGRVTGALTPLSRLDRSFPEGSPPAAERAYIQSMAAVRSLRERGGDAGIGLLLARMREGASFDAALRATYGLTLGQLYAGWEAELGREYGWAVALTDERGLWVLLALLVAGAYGFRRRAVHREIARRRRREDAALGSPDDHSLGVEEWDRTWEHEDDDEWRGEDRDTRF